MKPWLVVSIVGCMLCGCGASAKEKPQAALAPTVTESMKVMPPAKPANYLGFESAPVRPIALSADGLRLFVANTSNNSLEIYSIQPQGDLVHQQSVFVGLEPVAVAVTATQAWVVNHLSDSVSVVDISGKLAKVVDTLLVGDEPKDIVIANDKIFITTAHRGQRRESAALAGVVGAGSAQLDTPSIGRADVWVFPLTPTAHVFGGLPLKIVSFFGDSARGLAVTPDDATVYVGVFNSGNQTSVAHEAVLCSGFEDDIYGAYPCQVLDEIRSPNGLEAGMLPGGRTAPGTNANGDFQPWTSMIVKYDPETKQWQDTKGRNFSNAIRFTLPDKDVFALDTASLTETQSFKHVGTTLFNMAVNPVTQELYVTNTDANNATRFEGSGEFAASTVQGNIAKSRITVIEPETGKVKPRHLNRHIDYSELKARPETKAHSISNPTQIAISSNGDWLYSAAIGSNKVLVLPTKALRDDSFWDNQAEEFDPRLLSRNYFDVAGGPVGLALNDNRRRLYVFTRFDNSVVTLNIETGQELQRLSMFTPEPESFTAGRFMLYDANRSSSNGESSCASCHVFGDTDHLSWNLGNPDAANSRNPQPFPTQNFLRLGCLLVGPDEGSCQLLQALNGDGDEFTIASMKGPMMTQTMRGMSTHGHMHWRGDRANGYFGNDTRQTLDERLSFKNFIVAFEGLLGMDIALPASVNSSKKSNDVKALEQDMDKFADFMLSISLPPNPIRSLDNSLSNSAQLGERFFHGPRRADGVEQDTSLNGDSQDGVNCAGCHGLDPSKGFYGTRGEVAHGGEIQILKVPQLRNLYTRAGMFGLPDREGFLPSDTRNHQGPQVRGFGFLHDGATDKLLNFLKGGVFDNGEKGCPTGANESHGCQFNQGEIGIPDEATRQGLVDYMMEFDTDLAPIVGQQVTINASASTAAMARLRLLESRANRLFVSKILGGQVTECDLIATGFIQGETRGYLLTKNGTYRSDKALEAKLTKAQLLHLGRQPGHQLTFTCVVPGRGWQMALDADLDSILNSDEV
jgi:DNA-binding beta-propeller fold protein YncE